MPDTLAAKVRAKYPDAYTDLSDADLEAKVLAAHPEYRDLAVTPSAPEKESDSGAVGLAATRGLVAPVANAATELATNPAVPRAFATGGRVIGGLAPIVGGAQAAGLPGGLLGVGASAKGSWAGGKAGWFTGKMLQNMAAPVANGLQRLEPVAHALSPINVAQGGLDLAQIAEPTRKDIGFMGIGKTDRAPGDDKPAALNALAAYIRQLMVSGLGK